MFYRIFGSSSSEIYGQNESSLQPKITWFAFNRCFQASSFSIHNNICRKTTKEYTYTPSSCWIKYEFWFFSNCNFFLYLCTSFPCEWLASYINSRCKQYQPKIELLFCILPSSKMYVMDSFLSRACRQWIWWSVTRARSF